MSGSIEAKAKIFEKSERLTEQSLPRGEITKAKILETAEKIFSEKGFDGARVDNIAKEAGVNKALIYYYFKSKEEILQTILANLFEDAKEMLMQATKGIPEFSSEDSFKNLYDTYINFVTEKRKIINIAIIESAKANSSHSIVMELGNIIINAEIENIRKAYAAKGLRFPEDRQELLVMEFFTGLLPFLGYALFKDQWETLYNVSEEELRNTLYQVYKKTHLAVHLP
ncbi:MAG: TetR/AcrR family transcriptional regulator [Clostridiaceae bacterium]|nr:TetR/AcrR family transcriptional regulator [Clostridiaceae bacterium]